MDIVRSCYKVVDKKGKVHFRHESNQVAEAWAKGYRHATGRKLNVERCEGY